MVFRSEDGVERDDEALLLLLGAAELTPDTLFPPRRFGVVSARFSVRD